MSGGGGSSDTTVQTTEPWDDQKVLWRRSFNQLNKLYNSGKLRVKPYAGRTIANISPQTRQGWSMIQDRAQKGSSLNRASESYVNDVLNGRYLGEQAPGFDSVLNQARNSVNANYALGGRYGSGAHDAAVAQSLGGFLHSNYQAERNRMDAMAQFAPQLARERYFDAQQLAEVGKQRQAHQQDVINSRIQRYNARQQIPINELALYQNFIGGNLGGQTSTTQPTQQQSPWLTGLGLLGGIAGTILGG